MSVWYFRLEKVVRCEAAALFDLASGVCVVSGWVADELYTGVAAKARGTVKGWRERGKHEDWSWG